MSEVYIDGVNVAECEFYDRYNYTTCQIGIQDYIDCNKNPNCMFKQLQRAKAELEQYKNKTPFIDCKTCSQVKDLKAENEELKRLNSVINHFTKGLKMVMEENEKLKEIIKQATKDFNHEIGTPYYDKLCENAIKLKIIKDAENES